MFSRCLNIDMTRLSSEAFSEFEDKASLLGLTFCIFDAYLLAYLILRGTYEEVAMSDLGASEMLLRQRNVKICYM
ncbi:hypothetical protein IQ07DRAFT_97975 [Pyrenochaeta sp. DS3sAY3a]|nr:hypothetical protein IQ07DRAFT_97975 [Pyrenochaeta sp. DS3sAY3a]